MDTALMSQMETAPGSYFDWVYDWSVKWIQGWIQPTIIDRQNG
jgi:hypothetical protein